MKKSITKALINVSIFCILVYSAQAQLFTDPPSRSPTFYCSCSGGGAPTNYQNFWRANHTIKNAMGKQIIVAQYCNYVEFPVVFNVVADGGESIFTINPKCNYSNIPDWFSFMDEAGYDINEFANGDFETNGKLEVLLREPSYLKLKYTHPTKLPIGKTLDIYPGGGIFISQIKVYRPPVAMIHGLWADRESFADMENALINSGLYEPWQLYRVDYKSSNDRHFFSNSIVAQDGIEEVLNQCYDNFTAATKADVVCHSMGGLLTRTFTQGPFYKDYNSVNKIITCNTPHQGSQMANWLLDTSSYGGSGAAGLLWYLGLSPYNGAVEDLQVGSSAIVSIQNGVPSGDIKVHSVATVQEHSANLPSSLFYGSIFGYVLYKIVNTCGGNYISDIFDSNDSDIVVALDSQVGGLTGLQTELYNNQVHVGSTANSQVEVAVLTKLDTDLTDPAWASKYNKQVLGYNILGNCTFASKPQQKEARAMAETITMTAPTVGQNLNAGDNLTINFTASAGVDSVAAFLPQTQQQWAIKKVKANVGTITLLSDNLLLGDVKLVLIGYDASKNIVANANVTVNQSTTSTLNEIYAYPKRVFLNINDSLAVDFYGKYNDGKNRLITNDPLFQFSFKQNNASKIGRNIILNNPANDTLIVSYGVNSGAKIATNTIQLVVENLDVVNSPLPVNLISFTGKSTEKGNLLEWKTASETNFSHFEIERSENNQEFKKIGNQKSDEPQNYEYLDSTPPSGRFDTSTGGLYRLKMIDLDGKFSYSKIIFIKNEEKSNIYVFPNPFSNQISIENFDNKELKINLIDASGKELIKPIISTSNKIDLNTEKIGTSIYFLQIKEGKKVKIQKMIKQ